MMGVSGYNSLIIILIFGSLAMLSFLKITNPLNVNKKANFFFGIFLFLWSTFWIDEIALYLGSTSLNKSLNLFFHFIQFSTALVFYFSVVFFTNPNYKFNRYDVKYLILPIIFLFVLIVRLSEESAYLKFLSIVLILVQSLFYVTASYLKIRKHKKNTVVFSSNANEIDLRWLEYIILWIMFMSVIISVYNVFFYSSKQNLFINTTSLIIIFIVAYYSLKQKEIFPLNETQRSEIISMNEQQELMAVKRKVVSDEELLILKSELNRIMLESEPYLDSELNLIKLSALVNRTPHQVSYAINAGFNENFFQFINKYRVSKAKELLLNAEMGNLSMLGIAYESGFNSKTSFNNTFKKVTNQTPSEFKKNSSKL